jgi:hypothetical protein
MSSPIIILQTNMINFVFFRYLLLPKPNSFDKQNKSPWIGPKFIPFNSVQIISDSKLLSGFPFTGHGNSYNNSESPRISSILKPNPFTF